MSGDPGDAIYLPETLLMPVKNSIIAARLGVKSDLQLASVSGGTDIVSCFVIGNLLKTVYRGKIQGAGPGEAAKNTEALEYFRGLAALGEG